MLNARRKQLIKTARERADFLEQPVPESLAEQDLQARTLRNHDNMNWMRGSALLREMADELESPTP